MHQTSKIDHTTTTVHLVLGKASCAKVEYMLPLAASIKVVIHIELKMCALFYKLKVSLAIRYWAFGHD